MINSSKFAGPAILTHKLIPWRFLHEVFIKRFAFCDVLQESARFCVKWGSQGNSFGHQQALAFLNQVEHYWDVMHGPLGFDQTRGWHKEKRGDYKMNIYVVGMLPLPASSSCATASLVVCCQVSAHQRKATDMVPWTASAACTTTP